MDMRRGCLYYADLNPVLGSEQGGIRPVLNIQNNVGNLHSPTVIVAPLTSKMTKVKLPTHVLTDYAEKRSVILLEQIRTLDRSRILDYIGEISNEDMEKVEKAIKISLQLK